MPSPGETSVEKDQSDDTHRETAAQSSPMV